MDLQEMICKRKSVRSYTGQSVDEAMLRRIDALTEDLKPLYPQIRVRAEIVRREQVKCMLPWTTPELIAIFSEEKTGYLENVGFLYQQLDLRLQSMGLGTCWLGMGRMDPQALTGARYEDGLKFVMLLAFGYPKGDALRTDVSEFKRKPLDQISDQADQRLEPARLAPSSVNSQPWYFTHEQDAIHAYCARKGVLNKTLGYMNRIDMGIALAHMYVANPDTFRFFCEENAAPVKGYGYIGSFVI